MLSVVTEPFTHRATSERGDVLERSGFGSGGRNDNGIFHCIVLLEGLDQLSNRGTFLANSDINAVEFLGLVAAVVPPLLVQHGIEGDSSLTGLTITDDKFTLATSNWNHSIDGLQAGLYRLVDGTAGEDTRSLELGTALLGCLNGTLSINGVSKRVDDTAKQLYSNWDIDLKLC